MLAFEGVWIPEDESVEHVTGVGDRDGENRCLALLDVGHAVRCVQVDAVNDVHEGSSGQIGLNCWILVGLCCHSDVSQFITVCLVHRRCTHAEVEPDVFSTFEEDSSIWHDCCVIVCKEQGRCPILWHT